MKLRLRPHFEDSRGVVRSRFHQSQVALDLGAELIDTGTGWAESAISVRPEFGGVESQLYSSVLTTLAEYTSGMAAHSLSLEQKETLTVGVVIDELRPVTGERLRCRSEVIGSKKTAKVVKSSVVAVSDHDEQLVAQITVAIAFV